MTTEFKVYKKFLSKDEDFKKIIKEFGPCPIKPKRGINVFQAFVRSIIFQQLHGKAATAIYKRLLDHLKTTEKDIHPKMVLRKQVSTFKKLGISEAKGNAIKDLARKMDQGLIPEIKLLKKMPDDELITALTQVKGIGPWTVEMFMIFHLGREDITSSGDFALKKGLMLMKGLKKFPTPKEYDRIMQAYSPYRTFASWYLWRRSELP